MSLDLDGIEGAVNRNAKINIFAAPVVMELVTELRETRARLVENVVEGQPVAAVYTDRLGVRRQQTLTPRRLWFGKRAGDASDAWWLEVSVEDDGVFDIPLASFHGCNPWPR